MNGTIMELVVRQVELNAVLMRKARDTLIKAVLTEGIGARKVML